MPEPQAVGKWWTVPAGGEPVAYCVALGATLRRLREAASLAGAKVAREVLDAPRGQLARYETGESKPSLQIIAALCKAYDENPIEVLTRAAMLSGPPAEDYAPWTELGRSWLVWLQYDSAVPTRPAIERQRAERRRQQTVDEPTSP